MEVPEEVLVFRKEVARLEKRSPSNPDFLEVARKLVTQMEMFRLENPAYDKVVKDLEAKLLDSFPQIEGR